VKFIDQNNYRTRGYNSEVEHLPRIKKTLDLIHTITKKKKFKKEELQQTF
jgi:hypothetical protein